MKILPGLILLCLMISCNNSTEPKSNVLTPPVNVDELPGVAHKVTGIFKGELSCDKCPSTQVMLTLKDSGFSEIRNFPNAKDKRHSMEASLGTCIQDSGLIKLYSKNQLVNIYRIISHDSILLIDSGTSVKPGQRRSNFLVRNKKF